MNKLKKPNKKLQRERELYGWSQARVAEKLGTTVKRVSMWECGVATPDRYYQEKICDLFGKNAEELGFLNDSTGESPPEEIAETSSPIQSTTRVDLNGQQPIQIFIPHSIVHSSSPIHITISSSPPVDLFIQEQREASTLVDEQTQNNAYFQQEDNQWSSDVLVSKLDELRNVMKKSNAGEISRRQFILFGTSAILALSNPSVIVPEEILPFTDQNIATCWQMSKGSREDLTHTRWMLSSYIPTLTQLATQPSPHQKTAANQAAACYGLRSLLDYHLESLSVAEEDAKQFLYYSQLTEDPEWMVRAHVRFALISYYRGQPERALVACREANRYKNQVPPAALFSLYKEQASYEAQIGLKDEANASLHLAYENLERATHGQSRAYVDTSLYEWALWKGITHYHLGEYKESQTTFASVAPLNPDSSLPERVRTGLLNNLVFAELRTKGRDMEQCIMLWEHAVEWASKLQSELRLAEVRRAYDGLVLAFPHEPRVAALKEQIL